ncbi:hypothetical protein [Rhodococcus sp. BUPNP1]|uniref:hypothetical protein n=1 Tax=Rhodococcus sp. BUPNP1 TaxID=1432786 RepID=UPI000B5A9623|nr:hypothetical protein [Rhodococcus sp. BUPNP1]OWY83853.1 hypothetical protein B9C99_01830 [Rhodococcus sp. BUPNP1]
MPLPKIDIHYLGTVHSPFSGQVAETDDGSNTSDPTLLFVYYGDAGIWDHISTRVTDHLSDDAGTPEDLDPDELAALLDIDGGMVMVVDTDWNGLNYYGFAPVETGD